MSNIRPIGDPSIATAMVATFQSIDLSRSAPAGLSAPRWRILQCAHAGNASREALILCSGLNARALAEHVQSLRWKGLMAMDSYRLSASAIAMVEAHDRPRGPMITPATAEEAAQIIAAIAAKGPGRVMEALPRVEYEPPMADIDPQPVAMPASPPPLDPADVPACMRPDCMSVAETNTDGRGSAAVARPIEGVLRDDRVAPGRAPETPEEVAGSNPAPGQPNRAKPPIIPSRAERLRLVGSRESELQWSMEGPGRRDDAWQSSARMGSEALLRALRRHHPERCGDA